MCRFSACWLVVSVSFLVSGAAFAPAAQPGSAVAVNAGKGTAGDNPHVWKPRTKSVAVFKNGLGFFMREGDVTLREGWCVADRIPPAAFGTLAVYSHSEDEVVDVVGAGPGEKVDFDGTDAPKDVATKRARLEAAKNLSVELAYLHKGNSRTAAGRLVSVGPEFAILENDNSSFAVPIEGISRMQLLGLPLRIHVAGEKKKQPAKTTLGMAYLRKGITWIPEYSLKVLDDTTAELTLRGTIVNEAEDLVHCDMHLVVGVPHFVHTGYMAPIAVGQVIRSVGTAVAPPQLQGQIQTRAAIVSNSIVANQFGGGAVVQDRPVQPEGDKLSAALAKVPEVDAGAVSDYTVYTKDDLTLRRGEKAILTLFVRKIQYSHRYRWSTQNRIEHFLVLHNQSPTAWTTGACLATSDFRPLSEDLLKYTPKGGRAELPVTTAVNVAHQKTEREIDRKLKEHSPAPHVYLDLVTLEGTLQLHNFETRNVELHISAPVPGKPISAGDGGDWSVDPTKLKLLERVGQVRWQIILKPNEAKTLSYKYERYVPSR